MHNARNLNTEERSLKRLSMHGADLVLEEGINRIADFHEAFDENAILRLTRRKKCAPLICGWIKDRMIRPYLSVAVAKHCTIIIGTWRVWVVWVVKMCDESPFFQDVLADTIIF
jgi:hypothetical protein